MTKFESPKQMQRGAIGAITTDRAPNATADTASQATSPSLPTSAPASSRKRFALVAIGALIATAAIYEGIEWFKVGRFIYTTDDAYLKADMTIISAKVGGYIVAVPAAENSVAKVGDTLVVIDDGDYRNAVNAARNKIATQDATIQRLAKQIEAQIAAVDQARAQIDSVKADVARTSADFDRTNALARSQYASVKTLDQARADQIKAVQSVTVAQAAFVAAQANLAVAQAQKTEAEQTKVELQTALEKVERDLSFATVKAPITGIVGNRAAQIGDYVQPGTRLLALVPVQNVYVEANFKETQLARMKPGQKATVTVDSLGGRTFEGVVESLSPASGSLYSLLPPENATGNFTKIVQRLPVRIRLPADALSKGGLRAGLSVVVGVDTRPVDDDVKTALANP